MISLGRLFSRGWLRKSQQRRFVTVNGVRCKRLVLHDAYIAAEIERNLEAFGPSPRFPQLVTRFENELWVQFVPGTQLTRSDETAFEGVAAFYVELYARASRAAPTTDFPWSQRVKRDLDFLRDTGLIATDAWGDLVTAAERLAPPRLWTGFDYTDPVLKNFVRPANGAPLCAVDVESLHRDRPLGAGIAKAALSWMTPAQREEVFARLDATVPDLRAQLPFVELCFLARWTKTKMLTGKHKLVRADRFTPFRSLAS